MHVHPTKNIKTKRQWADKKIKIIISNKWTFFRCACVCSEWQNLFTFCFIVRFPFVRKQLCLRFMRSNAQNSAYVCLCLQHRHIHVHKIVYSNKTNARKKERILLNSCHTWKTRCSDASSHICLLYLYTKCSKREWNSVNHQHFDERYTCRWLAKSSAVCKCVSVEWNSELKLVCGWCAMGWQFLVAHFMPLTIHSRHRSQRTDFSSMIREIVFPVFTELLVTQHPFLYTLSESRVCCARFINIAR